jgi:hypothetical protein
MRSTTTPFTHKGITLEAITTQVGPNGYEVIVPAGTACIRLDEGTDPWVVEDLRFIKDKGGILYLDADFYGIHIPEEKITGIEAI